MRRHDGILLPKQHGSQRGFVIARRCCGGRGMVMIVKPIIREYPKCREGMAAEKKN
jgi:hypothetical protein